MAQHRAKRYKLSYESGIDGDRAATDRSHNSTSDTTSDSDPAEPGLSNWKRRPHEWSDPLRLRSKSDDLLLSNSSYKSSLLKIQLDELLSEVSVDPEKHLTESQKTVQHLRNIITQLAPKNALSIQEAEKSLRKSSGVEIPFPEPRPGKEMNYQLPFTPPSGINTSDGPGRIDSERSATINLAIQLPRELFQEKDYLNYRYFHKRAYYIACVAAGIQGPSKGKFSLSYGSQAGNLLLPTLLVKPDDKAIQEGITSNYSIQISTNVPEDVFPANRTLPFLNCVRSKFPDRQESEDDGFATPFYNDTLRSEATYESYQQLLLDTAADCDSFQNFCVLGRVWLRQRGFAGGLHHGGFGGWEWAMCCALLIEDNGGAKSMFSRYTSYQLFKTMLQFLGSKDLTIPVLLNGRGVQIPRSTQPVLYDNKRNFNVLYKMQRWSYEHLKSEAETTVRALNGRQQDLFDATFIARVNEPALRYDHLFRAEISSLKQRAAPQITFLKELQKIYQVLTRGLGNRVRLVNLFPPEPPKYPIFKKEKPDSSATYLTLGIILDPENAERLVDRGPSPERKQEIAEFRKFWGEKAELRRFKDGTISESLVWSADSCEPIATQITQLLMHRHFRINVQPVDLGLDTAQPSSLGNINLSLGHEHFRPLDTAFQSFTDRINQLDGLPLSVRSVMPTGLALRYALLRTPSETLAPTVDVILQFEGSARWPDNLLAIQRSKTAFLIKLGELLESAAPTTIARVGLENQSTPLQNQAFLDTTYHTSVNFRLRIHHDREELLLSRDLKSKDLSSLQRESASLALQAYKRVFIHSPSHTQSLRALCTRHPSLPPAIRLLKKWVSSHLLTPFLPQSLIELLAVAPYAHPYPWDTPSNPLTAFLRTLNLISKWTWPTSPLILDLFSSPSSTSSPSSLTPATLQIIRTNFTAWRKLDPDMNTVSLFVASNIDHSGVAWTQGAKPPKVVAARLSSLASAAVEVVKSSGLDLNIERLFRTSLENYDFLIHLEERFTREGTEKRKAKMGQKYKNIQMGRSAYDHKEIVELFVADAKRVLNDNALLFHGEDGEPVIAGLWNPRSLTRRQLRVRMGFSAKAVDENGDKVVINTEGILAEVGLIGEGIVKRIEVLKGKEP